MPFRMLQPTAEVLQGLLCGFALLGRFELEPIVGPADPILRVETAFKECILELH